jgi:hypothetical protein
LQNGVQIKRRGQGFGDVVKDLQLVKLLIIVCGWKRHART